MLNGGSELTEDLQLVLHVKMGKIHHLAGKRVHEHFQSLIPLGIWGVVI